MSEQQEPKATSPDEGQSRSTVGLGNKVSELREQMKVINQMILEVAHAQNAGPDWYSRGENGLRAQVRMWVERGHIAANKINEMLDA